MKRSVISILLIVCLLLCACGTNSASDDTYTFYYPVDHIEYNKPDGVIAAETQRFPEAAGEIKSLLNRYLQGPITESLHNPFPAGSAVTEIHVNGTNVSITLNNKFSILKDLDFSLACVCLVKTVLALTPADHVVLYAQTTFSDGSAYKAYYRTSFLTDDNAKELGNTLQDKE